MTQDFRESDRIDVLSLSHPLDQSRIVYYPGDPQYRTQPTANIDEDGYALNYLSVGEHTGTHWGVPSHFNPGQASADQLDPRDFFLPGIVLDIQQYAEANQDYAVGLHDLETWESKHGSIPLECVIILNTGWHKRWPSSRFSNLDKQGIPRHPGFSLEAVEWLLDHGALGTRGALGTDAFSPDVGADQSFAVSRALYQEHRLSLEVLANLDQLPPRGFWVAAGGFITIGGTGSPASVQAIILPPR